MSSCVPMLAAILIGSFGPTGESAHEDRDDRPDPRPALEKRDDKALPASFEEGPEEMPAEIADEVKRIEIEHRSMLSGPIESWRLEPIRHRYEFLLKRATSDASTEAIRKRLATVARHEEMVRSARQFEALLKASRRRDDQIARARRVLTELEKPQRRPYVAEGLIQPSSRQVEGHRVFALIGPEGRPVAYLDVPPGLDARPMLFKRIGVRGSIHFDENLGAKLIAVRDLEPLE